MTARHIMALPTRHTRWISCAASGILIACNPGHPPASRPAGSSTPIAHFAEKTPTVHVPRLLKKVEPDYPVAARRARTQGVVVLEVVIGPDGTVTNATVLKGIPELDPAALAAVRQYRYEAPLLGSRPVSIALQVPVVFRLER